jgi:tight adherence protein C
MGMTSLLPLAIFGAITFGVWALLSMFNSGESRASTRLEELKDPRKRNADPQGNSVGSMLKMAAPTLSKAIQPKTELEQSELKIRLSNAGFHSPHAPTLYLAIKMMSLMFGALIGGAVAALTTGLNLDGLLRLGIGAGLGFYIPELVVIILKKGRQDAIFLQTPDVLDLLVVCVEAGLGLDIALRRVSEELIDGAPHICGELSLCNLQMQMGRPRREVLHDLGVRTGVDDVKALVGVLIQAERFGGSIGSALRQQSESMRTKRRQMAEEKAQQTAVKMIFPLVLFIFPGIFVVLVGPAAIMMIRQLLTT